MRKATFITALAIWAATAAAYGGELSDLKYEELLRLEPSRFVRDPFQRPIKAGPAEDALAEAADINLSGIFTGRSGMVAIIDGELRAVGDAVKGFRIIDIGEEYVFLEKAGTGKRLTLEPFILKGQ